MTTITKTSLFLMSHQQLLQLASSYNINTKNKLSSNLPHVTLQQLIWDKLTMTTTTLSKDQIEKINNTKRTPVINRNWYALYVRYGKEQSVIHAITEYLKINAIPNFDKSVEIGLISRDFTLDRLILNIGYPHSYDVGNLHQVENYKSYLLIEIDDLYDSELFYNIIEPFFTSFIDVIGFVGLNITKRLKVSDYDDNGKSRNKTVTVRNKQQFSKGGRSVLKYYVQTTTSPVNLTNNEVRRIQQTNNSFSIYDQPTYNIGDNCWFVTSPKHKCKITITKILDNNTYQVMGKDKFKFPVSISQLEPYVNNYRKIK